MKEFFRDRRQLIKISYEIILDLNKIPFILEMVQWRV